MAKTMWKVYNYETTHSRYAATKKDIEKAIIKLIKFDDEGIPGNFELLVKTKNKKFELFNAKKHINDSSGASLEIKVSGKDYEEWVWIIVEKMKA